MNGQRIVVTTAAHRAARLVDLLRRRGANTVPVVLPAQAPSSVERVYQTTV